MKSFFAKWLFSKTLDENKTSVRFVKNHIEKSHAFRNWAQDMTSVDEQLKASVNQAKHQKPPRLHQRTMDALHENAFASNEITIKHFLLSRQFAALAFSAIVLICTIVAISIPKQQPVDQADGISLIVNNFKAAQIKDQSRDFMVSYMDKPLQREGKALIEETQRAGRRLWQRFPLKPNIIPANYTPEED